MQTRDNVGNKELISQQGQGILNNILTQTKSMKK